MVFNIFISHGPISPLRFHTYWYVCTTYVPVIIKAVSKVLKSYKTFFKLVYFCVWQRKVLLAWLRVVLVLFLSPSSCLACLHNKHYFPYDYESIIIHSHTINIIVKLHTVNTQTLNNIYRYLNIPKMH